MFTHCALNGVFVLSILPKDGTEALKTTKQLLQFMNAHTKSKVKVGAINLIEVQLIGRPLEIFQTKDYSFKHSANPETREGKFVS